MKDRPAIAGKHKEFMVVTWGEGNGQGPNDEKRTMNHKSLSCWIQDT